MDLKLRGHTKAAARHKDTKEEGSRFLKQKPLEGERWAVIVRAGLHAHRSETVHWKAWPRAGRPRSRPSARRPIRAGQRQSESSGYLADSNCVRPAFAYCHTCPSSFYSRYAPAPSFGRWEGHTPWSA